MDKGAVLASMVVIALASVFAGAGTMAYFSGVTNKSGSFATGTLTLDEVASNGWILSDLSPGDEWTTQIELENTGSLDAMYVYMGFYISAGADLADKIVLEEMEEWCYLNGWCITTFDETTSNSWLTFWGGTADGSISLYDLATVAMTGGSSTTTSIKLHTGDPPASGPYLPATRHCIIKLKFKLLEDTNNPYQGKTCSFTIKFIATNAVGSDVDNL